LQRESDWKRARELVTMLVRHWTHEQPIRADLATTYRGIVGGGGYCADYVRVYLACAVTAGLFCRQWAFSFDGFGGHGHTFVEIFDRQHRRWAFIDVHNNVFATCTGDETPLDALSLWRALTEAPASVEFRRVGEGRLGFRHFDKLLAYYLRGADEWYLWWGNDVISREHRSMYSVVSRVSGQFGHRFRSVVGHLPAIVVLSTPENEAKIARMLRLRRLALAAALVAAVSVVMLVIELEVLPLPRFHG
ncbi:MAG: hypothetical protein ABIP49_07570, partial [Lysobacterales bacterium]